MNKPFVPPAHDKREELKTYRELALRRDLKSASQRRRIEAGGKRRVIGDGSSAQPYVAVEAARYREVRLEVQRRLLLEARRAKLVLPADQLLNQLRPRIEALTYARLVEEIADETLASLPIAALGRALTAEERVHFAASRAAEELPLTEATPTPARKKRHASTLNHVLGQIEKRQSHNPARYQTIWAQVVGADIAQQTHLEQVDAATQTAWFRCLNSVLSSDLQRRPGLAQKLSKALGMPVKKLRARF